MAFGVCCGVRVRGLLRVRIVEGSVGCSAQCAVRHLPIEEKVEQRAGEVVADEVVPEDIPAAGRR